MVMAATSMVYTTAYPTGCSDDLPHAQKPSLIGGLSSLFGTSCGVRSCLADGLGFESRRAAHVDLGCSGAEWKLREQSPVSVRQSPPGRSYRSKAKCSSHSYNHYHQYHVMEFDVQQNLKKWEAFRFLSRDIFLSSALGPCVNPASDEEFTFPLEGMFTADTLEPYAQEILWDAQAQHRIFKEDSIIKAFHHAEKAHRGQETALE